MTTPDHQKQVINMLKFYRSKLQKRQENIQDQFDDARQMNLQDQMYTKAELTDVINAIKGTVKSQAQDEFDEWTAQSCMFLKHLYLQAEGMGQTLLLETKTLDDGAKLQRIGGIDLDANIVGAGDGSSPADAALMMKINDTQEQLARVEQRASKLTTQVEKTGAENNRLEAERKQLESEIAAARASAGAAGALAGEITKLRSELSSLQEKNEGALNAVRVELFPLKDELSTKVCEATQYKQLKKMIEDKNKIMRDVQLQIDEKKA